MAIQFEFSARKARQKELIGLPVLGSESWFQLFRLLTAMARRKAARLTASKKKSTAKAVDPDAPTDSEWKSMTQYNSFACMFVLIRHVLLAHVDFILVVDDEGKTHKFSKDDT